MVVTTGIASCSLSAAVVLSWTGKPPVRAHATWGRRASAACDWRAALGERERGAWWCVCGGEGVDEGFTRYVSAAVEITEWIHTWQGRRDRDSDDGGRVLAKTEVATARYGVGVAHAGKHNSGAAGKMFLGIGRSTQRQSAGGWVKNPPRFKGVQCVQEGEGVTRVAAHRLCCFEEKEMETSPRLQRRTRDWFTDVTCHTQVYPAHMPGKLRCGRQGRWVGRGEGGQHRVCRFEEKEMKNITEAPTSHPRLVHRCHLLHTGLPRAHARKTKVRSAGKVNWEGGGGGSDQKWRSLFW